jgi:methylmalonyl-CoA mutase
VPDLFDDSLLSEFPAVSYDAWRARVERDLGRPVASLDAPTVEGPTLRPLCSAEDGEPGPRPPARAPGWSIALCYATGEPEALTRALRCDAAQGLEVAWVELHGQLRAGAAVPGATVGTVLAPEALPSLVDAAGPGVALHIDAGLLAPALARVLLELRGGEGAALGGDERSCETVMARPADAVLCDPLATLASAGGLGLPLDVAYARLAETTNEVALRRSSMRTILVDAVAMHDAGASAEQEVAFAIAGGLEHLRRLEAHGLAPAAAVRHLALRMAVGGDLLVEVAKLRAVQRLWARVRAHAGLAEGPPTPLWVRSSWRASTRRDPWVNLLRGSVAGFAAVVGGAAVVAVQPFTEALGEPDDDARRWAIHTQHILRGEAHLGAVDDPAAGSWTFEAITDALARGAWEHARRWLADGGVATAIERGVIQAELAERAAARARALATGGTASIGTTLYPLLDERIPEVQPVLVPTTGITSPPTIAAPPLARRRLAEPFEALRDHSDAVARAGRRPRAALVAVGDASRARPQLDFARNFVAIGGFSSLVVGSDAVLPPDVELLVLCAAPEVLAEHGPAVARRLRDAGARRVLVAGRPTDALREAGVHDFVHRGRDVLALWSTLHAELSTSGEVVS